MTLPKKVIIRKWDNSEMKAVKEALNALIDFHYQVHMTGAGQEFTPQYFHTHSDLVNGIAGGGGC